MRVLHLLKHTRPSNGHVHVAVDLACEQARAGHEVSVVHGGGAYDRVLQGAGVSSVVVPELERGARAAGRALVRLAGEVRRRRPRVLHAHMMSAAVLGRLVAPLVGARLVTTVHNSFDQHSSLMRLGHVVVAVSEQERQLLLGRGYRASRLRVVLNGPVATAREASAPDPPVLPRPCVVTLSGLHARKGLTDVVAAFAELAPDFPQWHLVLVGDGPDAGALRADVAARGLTGSVHLPGATENAAGTLAQADVFVSASLAEPFGLSVAEARAAGCAVVATAVGGVPEVLGHGAAGLLVPPSDPAALAGALRSLLAGPEELALWRLRARTGAEAFSAARMAADYDAVYEAALAR